MPHTPYKLYNMSVWNFKLNMAKSPSFLNKQTKIWSLLQCSLLHSQLLKERFKSSLVPLLPIPTSNQSVILSIIFFKFCLSLISFLLSKPSAPTLDPSHHYSSHRRGELLATCPPHIDFGQSSPPISSSLNSQDDVFHIILHK